MNGFMILSNSDLTNVINDILEGRSMAQLWGGRFTKDTKEEVFRFNESLSFEGNHSHPSNRFFHLLVHQT